MEAINVQNKTRFTPKFIASVGILSGISIVLMQILEFPIPFMPPFLKFDFSTLPALIGGFAYGPVTGIAIAFIKSNGNRRRTCKLLYLDTVLYKRYAYGANYIALRQG